ncbi:MAG: glycoside hydrolase family 27 protein [Terracidiphilus sp.]
MDRLRFFLAALLFVVAATLTPAQNPAPTPPMGWNSWDAYGLTINEADFKANAAVLATVKQFGWQYAVIDEGWYMENPNGRNLAERKYLLDANGILLPVVSRFPTSANGAGFKPLADWVHAQGLKFGIHIVRGIPRDAVKANLPIAGTSFHAADAADLNSPCGWDDGNWGVADNAAGQAYYDSMLKLYAGWGLDFLKVDCISDHPYRPTEIRQIAAAIGKTGRPIVLSLSPGPTQLEHAAEVAEYAQMWRITNDHWDGWKLPSRPEWDEFPFGLSGEFDRIAKWFTYVKPGNWPDADMLPWGWLGPHPGWGELRQSRLTHDEEQTELTLWSISRSPLILGANLTKLDDFTKSLITNKEVIEVNQNTWASHPITNLPVGFENVRVWEASEEAFADPPEFVALFNLDDKPVTLHFMWKQICQMCASDGVRNLYDGRQLKASDPVEVTLPAHGSTIFRSLNKVTGHLR